MIRFFSQTILLACATVALASCAGTGATVYKQSYASLYRQQEIIAEHYKTGVSVDTVGSFSGVSSPELTDTVAKAMDKHNEGPPLRFHPRTTDNWDKDHHAAVLFQPAPDALAFKLCEGTAVPSKIGNPNTAILAYCRNGKPYSDVWVTIPAGAKPGDKAFNDAFALATRTLLPINPEGRDRCDFNCQQMIGN
ncbi:MAG: hypothetical protein P1V34_05300 [Alphaproteobacteria bacterium]|nr:hypothetical protein [Alphaproteobacteria bacterium]